MTWGAKASQLGYDVNTAADYQLLYSSQWPLLKIEAQGTATIDDLGVDQVLYTHNLGYIPMFWVFDISGTSSGFAGSFGFYASVANFGCNETHLKYFNSFAASGPHTVRYIIFRLDLDTTFTAPTINLSPGASTIIDNYGIKVAGPGKDVSSTDMRDFTVHSSTRSPMVHSVAAKTISTLETGSWYVETWTHELGYKPMFFPYVKSASYIPGATYYCGMLGDGSGNQYLDFVGTTIRVHSTQPADKVSVVIMKDQLLL